MQQDVQPGFAKKSKPKIFGFFSKTTWFSLRTEQTDTIQAC